MTGHRHRYGQRIAKGYRAKSGGTVGLMVRFAPEEFDRLRALAVDRGIPMAAIVRELVADWVLRGPVWQPPAQCHNDSSER